MFISSELFNAINFQELGYEKIEETIFKGDRQIAFLYPPFTEGGQWEINIATDVELSDYEQDYRHYVGQSYFDRYYIGRYFKVDGLGLYFWLPSPQVWEEFESIKGSMVSRKSWFMKKTGKRGQLTKLSNGKLWPKKLVSTYAIDGVLQSRRVTDQLTDIFYYRGEYFTSGTTYNVRGQDVPLSVIIQYGNECEDHGVYIGHECPDCRAQYQIHSYSTKAEDRFPFKSDGEHSPEYMGIELEYAYCDEQKSAVYQALKDHALLKHDGSIRNGFEIVTAPSTIGVHKKAFSGFYNKVKLDNLTNCGMHVHVDKRKMGQMQLGKLIAFIYNQDNTEELERLAGRSFSTNIYCRGDTPKKVTHGLRERIYQGDALYRAADGKYQALNTSPTNTIEFRIFAPPTDETTLFSRLELVQALLDWTKPAVCSVKDAVNWEKFKAFVFSFKKFYPNLIGVM